ncbi:cobyric acid synthase [Corynebacterium sp. CCM 8835]|uniref:Cobyric acid synthase n=1 Tax=Corynebacterium antarcticum TaxID=2800405 RepID=A0ABS1FJR5_9CORY|nr:cobyric acid synthase [Corynebacterium antarcticum]MCK7641671.1 cobyric acid synthase [Corynebacterium antarcticum]MCK7660231.1 cobyric acid synthase [Corynebacterium antarcticum]MCL0244899.1 cobyric acid synthase [Corynebacterium antarcticum]MCX7491272.1 cobyric acid synthase [Corynebacterium antarcticum]MCX7539545.1 cobyric acid synthase [Corynebacterium antarcticum]
MSAILIAGTTSDAGKSVIVAGICRALARRGVSVAPFKAQNMSNNSAVCPDGGEIGRAQALQATACGLEPSVDFNPVLLKPGSDRTSQLVVRGRATGSVSARNYIEHRTHLRKVAAECLGDLRRRFDVVICEGAGSPAEINLRATDVANFGLAEACELPVYIVGDIDRGGVLAHLYGTHQIVDAGDRARIRGFIINKFRGDQTILDPGLVQLEELTGVPTVGVLPFIDGLWIDAEDSLQSPLGASVGPATPALGTQRLRVAAVRLPRISNATDVEALACEPGVSVVWSADADQIADADLVVLPGTRATVDDLAWLRRTGIAGAVTARVRENQPVLGICGGYQMLCRSITDPVESGSTDPVEGLGVFDTDIVFHPDKTLIRHEEGAYEVHHGRVVRSTEQPWIGDEGARRGVVFGTHRHGHLEHDGHRRAFLRDIAAAVGRSGFVLATDTSFHAERLRQLDLIADAVEQALDLDTIIRHH